MKVLLTGCSGLDDIRCVIAITEFVESHNA